MERYSLRDAQDHLQKLIADAQYGKTVQSVEKVLIGWDLR